jgi:hypothetical protein
MPTASYHFTPATPTISFPRFNRSPHPNIHSAGHLLAKS